MFRAVVARVRLLRKSSQYLLVILQGKMSDSANLRNYPQHFINLCRKHAKSWLAKLSSQKSPIPCIRPVCRWSLIWSGILLQGQGATPDSPQLFLAKQVQDPGQSKPYHDEDFLSEILARIQSELKINRKCEEKLATPHDNPKQRKRINRVPCVRKAFCTG